MSDEKGILYLLVVIVVWVLILVLTNSFNINATSMENKIPISRIIRVYDGDTVYVDIDGLPPVFGKNIGVRIPGIDTPEMRVSVLIPSEKRKCLKEMGKAAKLYLYTFIMSGKEFVIVNPQRDKYFRINGDILVDDVSAKEYMLASPHARAYDGGFKEPWECTKN